MEEEGGCARRRGWRIGLPPLAASSEDAAEDAAEPRTVASRGRGRGRGQCQCRCRLPPPPGALPPPRRWFSRRIPLRYAPQRTARKARRTGAGTDTTAAIGILCSFSRFLFLSLSLSPPLCGRGTEELPAGRDVKCEAPRGGAPFSVDGRMPLLPAGADSVRDWVT